MDKCNCKLTVYFEEPFWVSVFTGVGTKSQQALQLQREEMKIERKQISKWQKDAEKQYQFDLKQKKKKDKHRGR